MHGKTGYCPHDPIVVRDARRLRWVSIDADGVFFIAKLDFVPSIRVLAGVRDD